MFDWLRRIVAGAKNRMVTEKYDLDLTYITTRIIAMAFPASGFEQVYRNRISDVAGFLQERHGENYYVLNVSGRGYDGSAFGGRVQDYDW
jgi:phosphatidylinositol-3,4,5-trisphosphate 3-phosphatase and dual-specificity protein phosphatase PTEN